MATLSTVPIRRSKKSRSLEEIDPQILFELFEISTDCRLRQVYPLRRRRGTPRLCDGQLVDNDEISQWCTRQVFGLAESVMRVEAH